MADNRMAAMRLPAIQRARRPERYGQRKMLHRRHCSRLKYFRPFATHCERRVIHSSRPFFRLPISRRHDAPAAPSVDQLSDRFGTWRKRRTKRAMSCGGPTCRSGRLRIRRQIDRAQGRLPVRPRRPGGRSFGSACAQDRSPVREPSAPRHSAMHDESQARSPWRR